MIAYENENEMNASQVAARERIGRGADFDSFDRDYYCGAGSWVVEWFDADYRNIASTIDADGAVTSSREIWC